MSRNIWDEVKQSQVKEQVSLEHNMVSMENSVWGMTKNISNEGYFTLASNTYIGLMAKFVKIVAQGLFKITDLKNKLLDRSSTVRKKASKLLGELEKTSGKPNGNLTEYKSYMKWLSKSDTGKFDPDGAVKYSSKFKGSMNEFIMKSISIVEDDFKDFSRAGNENSDKFSRQGVIEKYLDEMSMVGHVKDTKVEPYMSTVRKTIGSMLIGSYWDGVKWRGTVEHFHYGPKVWVRCYKQGSRQGAAIGPNMITSYQSFVTNTLDSFNPDRFEIDAKVPDLSTLKRILRDVMDDLELTEKYSTKDIPRLVGRFKDATDELEKSDLQADIGFEGRMQSKGIAMMMFHPMTELLYSAVDVTDYKIRTLEACVDYVKDCLEKYK